MTTAVDMDKEAETFKVSILRSALCILCSAFCILHSAFCILRSAFCVLHAASEAEGADHTVPSPQWCILGAQQTLTNLFFLDHGSMLTFAWSLPRAGGEP